MDYESKLCISYYAMLFPSYNPQNKDKKQKQKSEFQVIRFRILPNHSSMTAAEYDCIWILNYRKQFFYIYK